MTPSEELDQIYIFIGNGGNITEDMVARIKQLEDIINPSPYYTIDPVEGTEEGCGCGNPKHCWECAAIRGGCPEDV